MNNAKQFVDTNPMLKEADFRRIQKFIYDVAGIHLSDVKRTLVTSRLSSRVSALSLPSFGQYIDLAMSPEHGAERTLMINALTTNETYFFREPEHFVFLHTLLKEHSNKTSWRIWSGASSSGEEIYTIAMVMAEALGLKKEWMVKGTDLSTKVLQMAKLGHYPLDRNEGISIDKLRKYCLKGVGDQNGTFLIDENIKKRCQFEQQNLMEPCNSLGIFDVIFLRNVMIYFDLTSKQRVLDNVLQQLKSGGYFFISHTESLMNIRHNLTQVSPSIYRKE